MINARVRLRHKPVLTSQRTALCPKPTSSPPPAYPFPCLSLTLSLGFPLPPSCQSPFAKTNTVPPSKTPRVLRMRAWPEGVVVGSGIPGRFLRPETDGRVGREKNKNKKIKHPGEISKSYGEARLPKMYRNAKVKAEVGEGKRQTAKCWPC